MVRRGKSRRDTMIEQAQHSYAGKEAPDGTIASEKMYANKGVRLQCIAHRS